MLAKSKLNNIETLISQALTDMEIRHEEFITILKEKDKYEKMKNNLRNKNEKIRVQWHQLQATYEIIEYFMINV